MSWVPTQDAAEPAPVTGRWLRTPVALWRLSWAVLRILRGLFAEHGAQLAIGQEELADILGATRQSINQELKVLEKTGAIALGRGKISLILAEKLQERCGVAV